MNIVYTFDEGYSTIAGVSLLSLLETNKEVSEIKIIIVDCGISDDSIENFRVLAKRFQREIEFVNGKNLENKIPISLELSYWSFVCYVRLFFPELLLNYKRVLHVDCDTLIKGSLESLYNMDLNDNICAACYDCLPTSKYAAGMDEGEAYYSNGIILFDLDLMRSENIQQKFIDYIVLKEGDLPHLDQDVLNVVLKNRIATLAPEYNLMTQNVIFKEKSCDFFIREPYYKKNQMKKAIAHPKMIHLVGYRYVSKPWSQPCYHPNNEEWISYYKKLNFKKNDKLLRYKSKKYGLLRELICWFWNFGNKIPFISNLEFYLEKKRVRKKCDAFS